MRWVSDVGLYNPKRRENELNVILGSLSQYQEVDKFQESSQELSDFVDREALRLNRHEFLEFLRSLYLHLHGLLNNGSEKSLMTVVRAIDQLLDVQLLRQDATRLTKLVEFLSIALERLINFQSSQQTHLLSLVCDTFGRLIKLGGQITSQKASKQIEEMLDLLDGEETKCCVGLKMLTQLAQNAPAQFNLHLDQFISKSYSFLFHEDLMVRTYTLEALKASLNVVKQRASGKRQKWYVEQAQRLMEEVDIGHGYRRQRALIALHLIVKNSAGNLLALFPEIADFVLSLTTRNEDILQEILVEFIPALAALCPQNFYSMYLTQSMEFFLNNLHHRQLEQTVLEATPDLIQTIVHLGKESPSELTKFRIQELADELQRVLSDEDSQLTLVHSAFKCTGYLSLVLHDKWRSHAINLLSRILSYKVDQVQIETTKGILEVYPETQKSIQDHLVSFMETSLASQSTSRLHGSTKSEMRYGVGFDEKLMVWTILSQFHFELNSKTLQLIQASLNDHLYNQDHPSLRFVCIQALQNLLTGLITRPSETELVLETIQNLLDHLTTAAVMDVSYRIRFELFSEFLISGDLHERLAQDPMVLRLSYGLYDESLPIRQSAIQLLGALGKHNIGAVHPPLHGLLIKILQDFQFNGHVASTSKITKESAMLLQSLLLTDHRVLELHHHQILEALISKLEMYLGQTVISQSIKNPTSEAISCLLLCLMEVASSHRQLVESSLQRIAVILSGLIKDKADTKKQLLVIKALRKFCEYFKECFVNFLVLPDILVCFQDMKNELSKSTEGTIEAEAMDSAIFVLSQWDPSFLRLVSTSPSSNLSISVNPQEGASSMGSFAFPTDEAVIGDEDYFNSEAINALMTALEDPRNLDSANIVKCLVSILKMLQTNGVFYLQKIIPVLAKIIRQADEKLRNVLFIHLSDLIRIIGRGMAPYCDVLMKICFQFWNSSPELTVYIINLISELVYSLETSFENYFQEVVPRLCLILANPGDFQLIEPVFHLLQASGQQISPYFSVLFPLLLQFVQKVPTNEENIPLHLQREVLKTVRHLLLNIQLKQEEKFLISSELFLTLIGLLKEEKSLLIDTKETLTVTMAIVGPQISKVFIRQIRNAIDYEQDELLEKALDRLQGVESLPSEIFSPEELESLKPPTSPLHHSSTPETNFVQLDIVQLVRTWDASDRSTREDWEEWIRSLSVEFLRQSSSSALRACYSLAQANPSVGRSLFKFSLLSVWARLEVEYRVQFQEALEMILTTPALPLDVFQPIIDLGEYLSFIENQEVTVSEELKPLNSLAEKCNAFSKASHYRIHH